MNNTNIKKNRERFNAGLLLAIGQLIVYIFLNRKIKKAIREAENDPEQQAISESLKNSIEKSKALENNHAQKFPDSPLNKKKKKVRYDPITDTFKPL
jgi:hypothetical protein